MPYAHNSQPGAPLRGAAFPKLAPGFDAAERAVRARGPEMPRASVGLKALHHNFKAAIQLRRHGFNAEALRQTWS